MALRHARQGSLQIRQHVADGDGLHARVDPFGRDHDRQAFGQVTHHLERDAPRADDDGGAELGDGDARARQRLAGLLPRGQVPRHPLAPRPESAQIDDVPDPSGAGGLREVLGGQQVAVFEARFGGPHRMDEVVGGVDAR